MGEHTAGQVADLAGARRQIDVWRSAKQRIVLTNGHFDLLHLGHVDYLQRAAALGDALVVGVNSDASTRALKGPHRPLVPDQERAAVLAALACVDLVVIFDELTADQLVRELAPDIYVKGGDWDPTGDAAQLAVSDRPTGEPPEARVVRTYGGDVRYLPYLAGHSTSALIETIVSRYAARAASLETD